jgi:hypothetical protein
VTLTPEILNMLDKHEPKKTKHAQLLTGHLARQRILPFTKEELQQHLERKAKRELDKQLAAAGAEAHTQEHARQSAAARHAKNARVVATFAKRAREAAIAAGATLKIAESTSTAVAAEAETATAYAMAIQQLITETETKDKRCGAKRQVEAERHMTQ